MSTVSEVHETMQARLAALRHLQPGWDREDARPMDPGILDAAREFAKRLTGLGTLPHIAPLSSGGVQFEWQGGAKILVFELADPQSVHYVFINEESAIDEDGVFPVADGKQAQALLDRFLNGITHGQ